MDKTPAHSEHSQTNRLDVRTFKKFEKIPTKIFSQSTEACVYIAQKISTEIQKAQSEKKPLRIALDANTVLIELYNELIRMHQEEKLSFTNTLIFQVAEYHALSENSIQSSALFIRENFFRFIDIPSEAIHTFEGENFRNNPQDFCHKLEKDIQALGGLDITVLGIGSMGDLGFNAPGTPLTSKTRIVSLDKSTRISVSANFFGEEHVPHQGCTLGLETLRNSCHNFLVAWGEGRSTAVKKIVEEMPSIQIPASIFQEHHHSQVLIDKAAAAELTRIKSPWFIDSPVWNTAMIKKAVVWLCLKTDKPILKLTDNDYNEYNMNDLINQFGSAYLINIKVFNELQHTITGWPGGKPNTDDSNRPERAYPAKKRVLVFSPHPDDDVISMGGTLIRLVDQGHQVHVAYQTSGNIAVSDEDVIQYADFFQILCSKIGMEIAETENVFSGVLQSIKKKNPGDPDSDEVRKIKTFIRQSEAKAACRMIGIPLENIHFLDMPFYNTGLIAKNPLGKEDIGIISDLLTSIRPHQVYAAGDLADPHGTHRVCLEAIQSALEASRGSQWIDECRCWLYRGAWHEWPINEIDMAVPMSPDELLKKRKAIFKHQSQKDSALFPGSDKREFWQRAEVRSKGLASTYDSLGFAEYEAIEGFKRWGIPGAKV